MYLSALPDVDHVIILHENPKQIEDCDDKSTLRRYLYLEGVESFLVTEVKLFDHKPQADILNCQDDKLVLLEF